MRSYKRSQRVADQIRRDASEIIADMLRDRKDLMVTVSTVGVSDDLKYAQIYYTVLGDAAEKLKLAEKFFTRATPRIQSELARRLHIRKVPEISMHFDQSLVEGMRITALIDEVMSKDDERED
jgi:ribosome-binding factor A